MSLDITPVCPECVCWMDEVQLESGKWLKCRGCGFMKKLTNRDITPLPDNHGGGGTSDVDDFNSHRSIRDVPA